MELLNGLVTAKDSVLLSKKTDRMCLFTIQQSMQKVLNLSMKATELLLTSSKGKKVLPL